MPTALTAAGRRINLSKPQDLTSRGQRAWQEAAWRYRDSVPELRFVCQYLANGLSRARLFAAEVAPRDGEPVPLGTGSESKLVKRVQAAAVDALERLELDTGGARILGRVGENLTIAGECYLLGEDGGEFEDRWSVRSTLEIQQSADRRIKLIDPADASNSRELSPGQADLFRLWTPHPVYYEWPDSPMRALSGTCEELVILGRLLRAHGRSRISRGEGFYVPDELTMTRPGGAPVAAAVEPTADDGDADDPFMAELMTAMLTPIADEADVSSVVPILFRGPAMHQDKPMKDLIGSIAIPRDDPSKLLERETAAVQRLARGLDLPAEILTGMGDVQHWGQWLISETTVRYYFAPRTEVIADALTTSYLRPMLRAAGVSPEIVRRICVWYDLSDLTEAVDRARDARDAFDRGPLAEAALLRALGFGEDDLAEPREILRRAALNGVPPANLAIVARLYGVDEDTLIMVGGSAEPVAAPGSAPGDEVQPADAQDPLPEDPLPATGPRAVAAALPPPMVLATELAQVDVLAWEELSSGLDVIVSWAIDRAENKTRSRAHKVPALATLIAGTAHPCAVLGADRLRQLALSDVDLLDQLADRVALLWERVTAKAADRLAGAAARLAGTRTDPTLATRVLAGADRGLQWLQGRVHVFARGLLLGTHEPPNRGEISGLVPLTLVRGALSFLASPEQDAGPDNAGLPAERGMELPTLATGRHVLDWLGDQGLRMVGRQWRYYGAPRVHPFAAHERLDGVQVASPFATALATAPEDDWIGPRYHPGDHFGCRCGWVPILADPAVVDIEVVRQGFSAALEART